MFAEIIVQDVKEEGKLFSAIQSLYSERILGNFVVDFMPGKGAGVCIEHANPDSADERERQLLFKFGVRALKEANVKGEVLIKRGDLFAAYSVIPMYLPSENQTKLKFN